MKLLRRAVETAALATLLLALAVPAPLEAQSRAAGVPDLSGVWTRGGRSVTPDEQGWSAKTFVPGEVVSASGHPSRAPGTYGLSPLKVSRADGTVIPGSGRGGAFAPEAGQPGRGRGGN